MPFILVLVCAIVAIARIYDLVQVWQLPHQRPVTAALNEPLISVIIPARNEAAHIGTCLAGLAEQTYRTYEVLVIDDRSTDRTVEVVEQARDQLPQLNLIHGEPLPPGWAGKCWACWQGIQRANGTWLLFLDADVTPQPALLASLHEASRSGADVISLVPRLEMSSNAERLVLPAFFELIRQIYPPARVNDPASPIAFAIGQCLLIRRSVYEHVDGHRAIRASILEDMELARLVKQSGHRLQIAEAPDLITVRMYESWATVRDGLGKNAVAGYREAGLRSAQAAIAMLLINWLPINLLVAGLVSSGILGQWLVLLGTLLTLFTSLSTCWIVWRRFRLGVGWALLLPVGTLVYFGIATWAALRIWLRLGVQWKGRIYTGDPPPPPQVEE